jgi:hypothetical protein
MARCLHKHKEHPHLTFKIETIQIHPFFNEMDYCPSYPSMKRSQAESKMPYYGEVMLLLKISFSSILGQSLVSKQTNQMAQTKFRRATTKTGCIETPPAATATTPTTARRGYRGQRTREQQWRQLACKSPTAVRVNQLY